MENELVIFNKYTIIENCIKRINSVYDGKLETLKDFNTYNDKVLKEVKKFVTDYIDNTNHISWYNKDKKIKCCEVCGIRYKIKSKYDRSSKYCNLCKKTIKNKQ